MNLPDKGRIRASFDRAATGYDAAAVLQRRVCDRLLAAAAERGMPARVLDAGCGTGYGARRMRAHWPTVAVVGADFAPAMLAAARAQLDAGVAADIEALPFADGSFDGWFSSLAVQWCDLDAVCREAARVLAPGGWLALSTLAGGTFAELREAFAGVDRHRHTLDFALPETLPTTVAAAGFGDVELVRETITLHYPDLRALLMAVKGIGANAIGSGKRDGMLGKRAWQAVNEAYERHREAAGLPASYDVILLTARK